MKHLPAFDQLYVVSDIHMGGKPGFQIFKHVERLGLLIKHLSTLEPERQIGLVLNGDVIDSLAQDLDGYVAMRDADAMMQEIYQNFSPVWNSMAGFVRQPNRRIVFVTGNHDIEMALPGVEESIRYQLTGGDLKLSGAISFATRGAGYACRVGDARVFCTHGNEVDGWNVVDYDKLGQLGNAINAGRDINPDDWKPNAGTRLVVDVMNKVKKNYPFVDLLKPETKIVVPILMVLNPGLMEHVDAESVFGVGWGRIKGSLTTSGLLSADAQGADQVTDNRAAADMALSELLGGQLQQLVSGGSTIASAEDLLLDAEAVVRGDKDADKMDADDNETLGWFGMAIDRLRGVSKEEALRKALLDWLEGDDTFDIDKRDDTFGQITGRVSSEVDFVVTGHTHLERALAIEPHAKRYYYNCGTWIRLIRFTQSLLNDTGAFADVMKALEGGTMADLDETKVGDGNLVLDRTATVRIAIDGNSTVGQLLRVGDGPGETVTLSLVPNSEFRK